MQEMQYKGGKWVITYLAQCNISLVCCGFETVFILWTSFGKGIQNCQLNALISNAYSLAVNFQQCISLNKPSW